MTAFYIAIGLSMIASAVCFACALLKLGASYDKDMGLDAEDTEE